MMEQGMVARDVLQNNQAVVWDESGLKAAGFESFVKQNFAAFQAEPEKHLTSAANRDGLTRPGDNAAILLLSRQMIQVVEGSQSLRQVFASLKQNDRKRVAVIFRDDEKRQAIFDMAAAEGIFPHFYVLAEDGALAEHQRKTPAPRREGPSTPVTPREKPGPATPPAGFVIKDKLEPIPVEPIRAAALGLGAQVFDAQKKAYRLVKRVAVNSSSVTYSTDEKGIWVKLYEPRALTTFTQAKIQCMLSQNIECSGLCWPRSIVVDAAGNFRGYTLQAFRGTSMHLCVFKRAGLEAHFPSWTRADLCDLATTILKKIRYMHSRNILFGCLNPAAIIIHSKDEVYFADADQYQIEGFPCTTFNRSFTAPELLDKKAYFATKATENFAVAELVFMLMMPGKTPYATGTDDSPVELIKQGRFPYTNGPASGYHTLPSIWRFMWSHLDSLKGCFYNVFRKGGKYSLPGDRKDAGYWEASVGHYKAYLEKPENRDSLKIYPTSFKRNPGETFYRCRYCGTEHPRYFFKNEYFNEFRICNSCLEKRSDVFFKCVDCGRTFYYSNNTALFHRMKKEQDAAWKDQKHCSDCKNKKLPCRRCGRETPLYQLKNGMCRDCNQERKKQVYVTKPCRNCGRPFDITVGDHEHYLEKGWSDPTKCEACRKNGSTSGRTGYGASSSGSSSYGSSSNKQSSQPPKKKGFFGFFK